MNNTMIKEKLQWQAESDARTMAEYQAILTDKNRLNRAIKEATKQSQDLNKRASAMQRVANIKINTGNSKQPKKKK